MAVLLACGSAPARAESLELTVAPLLSRTPGGPCPKTLTLIERHQPYREGSYGIEGRAPLQGIATGWRLLNRDPFSATWAADLLPAWKHCQAAAGISRSGSEPYREHSYLQLRFFGGQVRLMLDMGGMRDPNGYTPSILSAAVSQDQPTWSWGGSD